MTEITNEDLMRAIKEISKQLDDHYNDESKPKTDADNLKAKVAELESEQRIMREEMKQHFRKFDKKTSILTEDLIDVRSDIKLLEEK